jgi:outer membrane protein assembly factor BamD
MHRKRFDGLLARAFVVVASAALLPGCAILARHRSNQLAGTVHTGDQPDKVLYERATNEIDHGRFDVGRITLQTLINTYPDSEYLAKSKLAIADSYYKEGGVSGLTQSEAEYKDFITFFPTAPEAPEAQYRVGMAHFRLMGKPDRDIAEARAAEDELKEFLLKYPASPFMPRVKRRLREVQEVVADGDYKVAHFYYQKGAYLAARSRFLEIADQYPNFSQADDAFWYAGQTLEHLRAPKAAAPYYARLVKDYPLSPHVNEAKGRLVAMHEPVPRPTKAVLARAKADDAARRRVHRDIFAQMGGVLSSGPDLSQTRRGPVILSRAKTTTTEASNAAAPAPGGATIAVEPVSEAALTSGKPEDPKAADGAKNPKMGQPDAQAKPQDNQDKPNASTNPDTPQKKKGKMHFLKKLNPF